MLFTESIEEVISALPEQNAFILCDENTALLCYPLLSLELPLIVIPAGEENKNLDSCDYIWSELIKHGADRQSTLVCLGGGMICDIGAFAAATFQRGIDHILVPTTLLAIVDASTGGKCGVDFKSYKNYIGLFKEASQLIICPKFLLTLEQKERVNGWVEMLKHGLIANTEHYNKSVSFASNLDTMDSDLIKRSIEIKNDHCKRDFMETGIRKRLNFGHTIGHAIESLSLELRKPLSHGISVAYGIVVEAFLSNKVWSLTDVELERILIDFKAFLPELDEELRDKDSLMSFMKKDKKNWDGKTMFSLLNHIGSAQENLHVEQEHILDGLDQLNHHFS
ncbi:MAG: 3-dehydroquinate synthase [Bacteroidia bacterium]